MKITSNGATIYFITFIDDFSRKIWLYPTKARRECLNKFRVFKALVENQCQKKIKVLRLDNGGEFMSNKLGEFLKK